MSKNDDLKKLELKKVKLGRETYIPKNKVVIVKPKKTKNDKSK